MNDMQIYARKEIELVAPAAAKALLKHHRLLYRVTEGNHLVPLATGFLLRVDRHHFLVTAAHVLDANNECNACDLATYGQDCTEAVVLHGDSFRTSVPQGKTRLDDRLDVGFIRLGDELVAQIGEDRFLPPQMADVESRRRLPAVYGALGYPADYNVEVSPTVDTPVTPHPFLYISTFHPPEAYRRLGVSEGTHLLLQISNKKTRAAGGTKEKVPDLHGMSGGGFWRLTAYGSNPAAPRLLGVTIEWRQGKHNGLLASRMSLVFEGIRAVYPDLSPSIPRSHLANITTTGPGSALG